MMAIVSQEERANLRRVAGFAENGKVKVVPLHHSCITDMLDTIEAAETESAKLREQVSALLDLNDVDMELLDACLAEAEAISAHDDYQTGRALSTETRLKDARARLFAVYAKGTKVREKCEALGLNVTPCQQGAHDA